MCSARHQLAVLGSLRTSHRTWRHNKQRGALGGSDVKHVPALEIRAVVGAMEQRAYSLAAPRIDIGRGGEVRDYRNRLIRTNHVVFTEGGGWINETISRAHAHIAYEPSTGRFRLHDDGSEHGTVIIRGGKTISVLRGTRGVRLQPDDEVGLGEARVRIRLPNA